MDMALQAKLLRFLLLLRRPIFEEAQSHALFRFLVKYLPKILF